MNNYLIFLLFAWFSKYPTFIHSKILPQNLKFPFNTSNAVVCFISFIQCIVIIIVITAIMVVFLLEPSLSCSKAAGLFLRLTAQPSTQVSLLYCPVHSLHIPPVLKLCSAILCLLLLGS